MIYNIPDSLTSTYNQYYDDDRGPCTTCGRPCNSDDIACDDCGRYTHDYCDTTQCDACDDNLCADCALTCDDCNETFCHNDISACTECDALICDQCANANGECKECAAAHALNVHKAA